MTLPNSAENAKPPKLQIKLFAGAKRNWKYVLKASALALGFWILQFLYLFFFVVSNQTETALIRSFAFAGATLISAALIIGPMARISKYQWVSHRRTVGVWGFTFIIMHFLSVLAYVFKFNAAAIFQSTNPFANPVLFGLAAFWLFVPLYVTSTDWAIIRLGAQNWKNVHRLIYFGYILSVLHYTLTNPTALDSLSGYLLMLVTLGALLLPTIVFLQTIAKTKSKKAMLLGGIVLLFALILFALGFLPNLRTLVFG